MTMLGWMIAYEGICMYFVGTGIGPILVTLAVSCQLTCSFSRDQRTLHRSVHKYIRNKSTLSPTTPNPISIPLFSSSVYIYVFNL